MIRRLPIVPTLLVLAAVGVMIRLGLWQVERMHEKEALLASYRSSLAASAEIAWPRDAEAVLYARARLSCPAPEGNSAMSGKSASGESGQAHTVLCPQAQGAPVLVVLGWSRNPAEVAWDGGEVRGVIAPGPRLVADPPLAGLAANGVPDPASLPNNHLSYAVQWFLFAGVALVIYGLALRKRLAAQG